jgi:glycosyltransferase involved in cell wall biosynthesis
VLLHFGWDWRRKGGDLFCAVVAGLRDSGRDVVGVTVGGGDEARAAGRRLGLEPAVLQVHEARDDVRVFYAAADAFVAPSRAEGTPYSVLEAVSSGTAVVASEIPGHVDIARGFPACRLVTLEPGAICAAAASLLDRSPQQADMDARAGHEWVRENRHLDSWTEALMEHYEAALAGGR